jgi:signal transduction histidine kinase
VKKHQLYHGIRLSSNDFALATLCGGLFIIDSLGSLKQIFNKDCGLPEHNVKYVYEDSQGLLTLINRLPDLLRLDSGKMKLQAAPQDIVPFLKGIADSSRGLAGLNKPELEFIAENLKKYNRIVY